jgi:hypothetical protein
MAAALRAIEETENQLRVLAAKSGASRSDGLAALRRSCVRPPDRCAWDPPPASA